MSIYTFQDDAESSCWLLEVGEPVSVSVIQSLINIRDKFPVCLFENGSLGICFSTKEVDIFLNQSSLKEWFLVDKDKIFSKLP